MNGLRVYLAVIIDASSWVTLLFRLIMNMLGVKKRMGSGFEALRFFGAEMRDFGDRSSTMKNSKYVAMAIAGVLASASPSFSGDFNLLAGVRYIDTNSTYAYSNLSYNLNGNGMSGMVFRADMDYGAFSFNDGINDVEGDVFAARLLVGYSFVLDNTTVSAFAGPSYVVQSSAPQVPASPQIDEVGYFVAAEFTSLVGENVFLGGVVQYDSPGEAFFVRGFGTYQFTGFAIGPDVSYYEDSTFQRMTYGARVTVPVGGAGSYLSVIAGVADSGLVGDPSQSNGFGEIQFFTSF